MEVTAIRLRLQGVKLTSDAIRSATPSHGHLSLKMVPWRPITAPHLPYSPMRFAYLQTGRTLPDETMLMPLRQPRIERLEGSSFIVLGLETDGLFPMAVEYPQAWLCRLVSVVPTSD